MPICPACGKKAGGFSLRAFNEATGRCDHCDAEAQGLALRALDRFRSRFNELVETNSLTERGWSNLETIAFENGLDLHTVAAHIRGDLRKVFARVLDNRPVTASPDDFSYLVESLSLP